MEALAGYPPQSWLRGALSYRDVVHAEDLERVLQTVDRHTAAGDSRFDQCYRIVSRSGEARWVRQRTFVSRDDRHRATHYHNYLWEISDHARPAGEPVGQANRSASVHALIEALLHVETPKQIYELAVEHLPPTQGARGAAIYRRGKTGKMRLAACGRLVESAARRLEGYCPWDASRHPFQPVAIGDPRDEVAGLDLPAERREAVPGAMLLLPLCFGSELLGQIAIFYDHPHDIPPAEIPVASTLSRCISLAVARARSRRDLKRALDIQRQTTDELTVLNELLGLAVGDKPLAEILEKVLDIVLRTPWLPLQKKAGIFLLEGDKLRLAAQRDLSPALLSTCRQVPLGKCFCGRAAETRALQFSACVDERHEIRYEGMPPHGHYSVPLISGGELTGVLVLYVDDGHVSKPWERRFLSLLSHTLGGILSRKRAAEDLGLLADLFTHSNEGSFITDREGTILRVNASFSRITGYAAEDVLGHNPRVWKSDRQDKEFYRRMWQSIAATGEWRGEIWNRKKGGELYPAWLNIHSVRNAAGVVTHYVANFHDISEWKEAQSQIERLAHYDTLTGIPNRALLLDRLGVAIAQAERRSKSLAVMFVDIDRFKRVNDSAGHGGGDELLKIVARTLGDVVRAGDTIGRYGGDEFIVVLTDLARGEAGQQAAIVAEKIGSRLRRPVLLNGQEMEITASIGIALYPDDGTAATELVRNADTAMYHAKEGGRDRIACFNSGMNQRIIDRLNVERALRRAIRSGEFALHYQPRVNVASGKVVALEALVRWVRGGGTLQSPADFIPVAEESGLITSIGEWVLRTGCRQKKRWREAWRGEDVGHVSVNVSPRQFRDPGFAATVARILAETGLPASCLELEITENVLMDNDGQVRRRLQELKAVGVRLAIDDFGTGYSSLGYLKAFPVDVLKIDRTFIDGLPDDHNDAAIVRAIIAMAHSLGLRVVAEGVETEAQLAFLRDLGCDEYQGYLSSAPLSAAEIEARCFPGMEPCGAEAN